MGIDKRKEYYQAMLTNNSEYEGVFFVGVTSTGIFCHPTCPARKPKFENCEFFETAQDALLAGYRMCKRCQPLSNPNQTSPLVKTLVEAVEANPERHWTNKDFKELGIDPSTASRQFKKRFGMTFVAYTRARRMGIALNQIKKGENVIDAQLNAGYESSSGFRDAFSKIMGASPTKLNDDALILKAAWLDSPLGTILAIASDEVLYLLEFVERKGLKREIEKMQENLKATIVPGHTPIIDSIDKELKLYFAGKLKVFQTPLCIPGTPFQKQVWDQLRQIPYGETRSYLDLAKNISKPTAFRAVALSNAANQFVIVVPCHRVINSSGELGGYAAGLARKKWLLDHEKSFS